MSDKALPRTIGLVSATFVIVGYVVGATIFILPGQLADITGPAVFLAYLLAAIPAALACLVMAQIGAVLPVSGASFVLIRSALSPYLAFIYLWIMLAMAALVIPLIALGFADYSAFYFPNITPLFAALFVTSVFIVLNIIGISFASVLQNSMVIFFVIALIIFSTGGIATGNIENLSPLFPKGLSVVPLAAATAYFSYVGVLVIAEIAGEVKNPSRNIPKAILYSFLLITTLYVIVPLGLTMTVRWDTISSLDQAVLSASEIFLSKPFVHIIAIAAMLTAATSINGLLIGISRDVYGGAIHQYLPSIFSTVSKGSGSPIYAVVLVGLVAFIGIFAGARILDYAQIALIGLMVIQMITGIALMRVPSKLPTEYVEATFRLKQRTLKVVCMAFITVSAFFFLLLAAQQPNAMIASAFYVAVGSLYYYYRVKGKNE